MLLDELIKPASVACNVQTRSKKHCLELLSEKLAAPDRRLTSEQIFARLVERERLGCTSLAKGVAFPHCRVSGLETARGALLTLATPIEFDAVGGEMVDLVFGLMVPEVLEETHYAVVDRIAALLSDDRLLARLRAAHDDGELYRAIMSARPDSRLKTGSAGRG
ncbi:MAG TPA: PTS sugar transporter subunit IIA [Woeseiaceae bacterium]|nr:PTS sugar transporter subunit IIA [Woeseiaceae bacterium]